MSVKGFQTAFSKDTYFMNVFFKRKHTPVAALCIESNQGLHADLGRGCRTG